MCGAAKKKAATNLTLDSQNILYFSPWQQAIVTMCETISQVVRELDSISYCF